MPSRDKWHQSNSHLAPMTRSHFQYGPPQPQYTASDIPIPQRNDKALTRDSLVTILNYFATLIPFHFNGRPVRLIVHGGACMLLHPGLSALAIEQHYLATHSSPTSPHNALPRRTSTRDIDYIHRSFLTEWEDRGITDAGDRIKHCIQLTAKKFQIGADWMNSDADVSLPMALAQNGKQYDPVYQGAIQPNNIHLHTVYESNDKMLTLISVPPVWSIALKLERYTRYDPGDICLLLRNGTNLNNCFWTTSGLESWLQQDAWPMAYHRWPGDKKQGLQDRIRHAIEMVNSWDSETAQGPVIPQHGDDDDDDDWAHQHWSSSDRTAHQAPPPPSHHRPSRSESWTTAAPDPHHPAPHRHSLIYEDDSPDLDDQWLSSPTRPRSHRTSPSPWHAVYESEIREANHFVANVVQESMRAPPGVLSSSTNTTAAAAAARRTRAKQRSKHRHLDRVSKWARMPFHGSDSDADSELDDDGDDDDDDGKQRVAGPYSRTQNRRLVPQQQLREVAEADFQPRPSAWHIYAAPTPAPTPSQYASPPPPPPHHVRQSQSHSLTTSPYHFNLQRSHSPPPVYSMHSHQQTSLNNMNTLDIQETSKTHVPKLRRSQSTLYMVERRHSTPPPQQPSLSRQQHPLLSGRAPTPMARERHRPPPLELSPINHLLDL